MGSPLPLKSIAGGCSVISDNTLYVYSPVAFQALPLKDGGKWSVLENGVSVTGATCVKGLTNDDGAGEALWVVGGAPNTSQPHYLGLQRYSFAEKSWKTISPIVNVTQNRQKHAAAYLNGSASILVYAGSQSDDTIPSTQTFLLSTSSPYNVRAYTAKNHPALSPLLLQWGNNSAITVGGDSNDHTIYHFDPQNGWEDLGTSLEADINSTGAIQATIVSGSDHSKVLELYDMTVSPNLVSQIVLQDANGTIAQPGQTIGLTSRKRKRDLTLNDWPAYNATYAPTSTRSSYSLAQGSNGLVAISGGNGQHPVELFNQETNAWVDSPSFFGVSSSTSASSTSSSTSSPSSTTGAVASSHDGHPRTSLILGAALGAVLGFIALLLMILILIRWRRRRRRDAAESEYGDEKHRLSFADRGAPFMREAGGAVNNPTVPNDAFLAEDTEPSRPRSRTLTSQSSTANLVPPKRASMGPTDAVEMGQLRDPTRLYVRGERGVPSTIMETNSSRNSANSQQAANNRGSGWSGYFSGVTDLLRPTALKNNSRASGQTPRNSVLEPNPSVLATVSSLRPSQDTYLNYSSMRTSQDTRSKVSSTFDPATRAPPEIPPLKLAPYWDSSRVSMDVTRASNGAETALDTTSPGPAIPFRSLSSSRGTHSRTISTAQTSTDATSTADDTIFTADDSFDAAAWTPVTKSDCNSSPPTAHVRDTKSSSFYGDGSSPTPKSPGAGRKSDASFWGEPGPQEVLGEEEAAEAERRFAVTPTKATRVRPGVGVEEARKGAGTAKGMGLAMPEKAAVSGDMSWLNLGVK